MGRLGIVPAKRKEELPFLFLEESLEEFLLVLSVCDEYVRSIQKPHSLGSFDTLLEMSK